MRYLACVHAAVVLSLLSGAAIFGSAMVFADEDEEEVAVADLPAAVVEAVIARFPDGKIVEAEMETEDGKTVYEVEVKDDGIEYEVEVSAEGEILEVESEEDDDDEDDDLGRAL